MDLFLQERNEPQMTNTAAQPFQCVSYQLVTEVLNIIIRSEFPLYSILRPNEEFPLFTHLPPTFPDKMQTKAQVAMNLNADTLPAE
jgi:hypothetical protein